MTLPAQGEDNKLLDSTTRAIVVSRDTGHASPDPEEAVAVLGNDARTNPTATVIPDGGLRAWLVCLASFWVNGTLFGIINCAGVFYVELNGQFGKGGTESWRISLVGSLCIGTTFLLSPVASVITDRFGIRKTTFAGGVLVVAGMLLSSFANSVEMLYLTYSVGVGLGASLAYTPSLVILGHYFDRRLGLVNGIVSAGSSLFTIAMPMLLKLMLNLWGLYITYRILAVLMATVLVCAFLFKPLLVSSREAAAVTTTATRKRSDRSNCAEGCSQLINTSIWKNKTYLIWALAFPTSLFGYFVPYGHLVMHVKDVLPHKDGEVLIICIGAASGLGRIAVGYIADLPKVSRILLQQVSLVCLGIFTMLLAASNEYWVLIVMCVGIGVFDGCFISLLAPIAFDIVGRKGASQAIGFLLGLCSIPLTLGPPIAGWMYDHLGRSYKMAFLAAGVPPITGAILMFFIRCFKQTKEEDDLNQDDNNAVKEMIPFRTPEKEDTEIVVVAYKNGPLYSPTNGELNNRKVDQPS